MPKPAKNRNALRHGIHASEVVLPWENESAFLSLLDGFQSEYEPQGLTEEELVFDLTRSRWLKRRLVRAAQLHFHDDAIANQIGKSTKGNFKAIAEYMETQSKREDDIQSLTRRLTAIVEEEFKSLIKSAAKEMPADVQIEHDKLFEARLERLGKSVECVLHPLQKSIEGVRSEKSVIESAYLPEALEKLIRLEAAVDVRFEKTLGRLIALQDYRRAGNTKVVDQPRAISRD